MWVTFEQHLLSFLRAEASHAWHVLPKFMNDCFFLSHYILDWFGKQQYLEQQILQVTLKYMSHTSANTPSDNQVCQKIMQK